MLDVKKINELAAKYRDDMANFLCEMISIPSTSCHEKEVVLRIKAEMEKVGFDEVTVDGLGNVIGRIGHGPTVIAMDAHIDTVDVGDPSLWQTEPYKGIRRDGWIIGRGASDQESGMASMVYAGKIIKELGLDKDYTLYITGTVMEEDCDGLCWQYLIKEVGLKPEFVVITEPTNLAIYRGHRGRMEIKVTTRGLSAHGSAPERGINAIYKMAPILLDLEKLNERLKYDPFLGKGSLTVSQIFFTSPSQCAVADSCTISIDRRLTAGEDKELALNQIRELPSVKAANAEVEMYEYAEKAYTGLVYPTEKYYPTWKLEENHPVIQAGVKTFRTLFGQDPKIDKWTFSTNGVAVCGMFGIPCIGFGPGNEIYAHAPNEKMEEEQLVKAAAFYAALPSVYLANK